MVKLVFHKLLIYFLFFLSTRTILVILDGNIPIYKSFCVRICRL